MPHFKRLAPTLFAVAVGIVGVLVILYAWQLPPFTSTVATTRDAYIRGRITTIAPQLSGYVAKVAVSDFQKVAKGDVVVRLETARYRQKLAQARASLDGARAALSSSEEDRKSAEAALATRKAEYQSAQAALDAAKTDFDRAKRLSDRGVTSTSDLDDARLALRQAKASAAQGKARIAAARQKIRSVEVSRKALTAKVAGAEAAVRLARLDLDHTTIRAPETGRLGRVTAQAGQYVTPGSSLARLVGRDLWVMANFKETQIHGMQTGQPVRFTVDALEDAPFTGRIARFSPATASEFSLLSGSNATGNFTKIAHRLPVRIAIAPDQAGREKLAPGLSVVVKIDRAAAAGATEEAAR